MPLLSTAAYVSVLFLTQTYQLQPSVAHTTTHVVPTGTLEKHHDV